MKYSFLDLLGSALVPILRADVAAGSSCNIHLGLITVAALRTLPDQLAVILGDADLTVKAADLAVVRLGVKLGIHNVVVNKLHNLQHGRNIVLHIGNLNVRDATAG